MNAKCHAMSADSRPPTTLARRTEDGVARAARGGDGGGGGDGSGRGGAGRPAGAALHQSHRAGDLLLVRRMRVQPDRQAAQLPVQPTGDSRTLTERHTCMMHLATSHTHPLRPAPFHDPQVNTTDQPFAFRQLLVDFCGPKWTEELVPATCCSYSQLQTLEASLAAARRCLHLRRSHRRHRRRRRHRRLCCRHRCYRRRLLSHLSKLARAAAAARARLRRCRRRRGRRRRQRPRR